MRHASSSTWPRRLLAPMLALAMIAALLLAVSLSASWRALLSAAFAQLSLASVLVMLPLQLLAFWVCSRAGAQFAPEIPAGANFAARLLRDVGNSVLVFAPGFGEVIGARAMVLAGGSTRGAVSVRMLDNLAETLAQLPYVAIALVVLARVWRRIGGPLRLPEIGLTPVMLTALVVLMLVALGFVIRRLIGPRPALIRRLRAEYRLMARQIARRRGALPRAMSLHAIGWALSGVQIWLAARVLGIPLGLGGGIAMESAASSLRVLLFFVPGGLVGQEAGMIGAGLAFGLAPAASLALALALRLRDLAFGLVLLWWPWLEIRARGRALASGAPVSVVSARDR